MNKIIIIGGGASGLMAAYSLSKNPNNNILLLEKNKICGKKILVTGNGKCNYFNENQDINNYHSSTPKEIEKIITPENISMVKETFSDLGIVPKIKNGYYYPFSNQAQTIRNVLLNSINKTNVTIKEEEIIENISIKENIYYVKTNNNSYTGNKLIIATGSKAAPKTGSNGDGYKYLQKFGHSIVKVLPALVQLKSEGKFLKDWAGIRTNVKINLYENGQFITKEEGEIQLTNYGVSGICIFNLSSIIAKGLDKNKKEELEINFIPFIEKNQKEYLNKLNKENKTIKNLLDGILNYKLVDIILNELNINENKLFSKLTDEELNKLINKLTKFKIKIIGTNSFEEAQVCSGGIPLTEVNLKTLESKKQKNLYIIGELLDIDGNCGGYNLTVAWITGLLSGRSI